jgi:hypothetical protein
VTKKPPGSELGGNLIGPVIIQDRLFGTGLRTRAYRARFGSRIDSSEQCSAEMFILLTISGSPDFLSYFSLQRRTPSAQKAVLRRLSS